MVSLQKIARLASESRFDSVGSNGYSVEDIDLRKVQSLGEGTKHDVCASTSCNRATYGADRIGDVAAAGVCHAFTPDGRCVNLFKTLYTNDCSHQCRYCPNSALSGKAQPHSYTPEELARITLALYRGNYVEGLFLSSGVGADESKTMEQMLEAVRILRERHKFMGYVHLKILPGASLEHVKQASELADRVSVNVEAPSQARMGELSYTKDYENDILQRQRYVRDLVSRKAIPSGQTTQFVVGAAGESDSEIFASMMKEYGEMKVRRAYFSSFSSVKGTPLEGVTSQPLWRENRLYQMDWLYRIYKMKPGEISLAFGDGGFLGNQDPKVSIALQTIQSAVDPNEASYDELLRVPGIGPVSASRITRIRKRERIVKREQLQRLGVVTRRADPFISLNGWRGTKLDRWAP